MSIISIHGHVHFEGDCLRQLAEYFVDLQVGIARGLGKKTREATTLKGSYKKTERLYHDSVQFLAGINQLLTEKQRMQLHDALETVLQCQALLKAGEQQKRAWKERKHNTKKYAIAQHNFNGLIEMTSDRVIGDVSLNGINSEACRLYRACGHENLDPQEMVENVMGLFHRSPKKGAEAKPEKCARPEKQQKAKGRMPSERMCIELMSTMADYLESK